MCRISKISDDWVVKGFHLHVDGIELAMRPDHRGGIVFRKVFQSTSDQKAHVAMVRAKELLEDKAWRTLFYWEAIRARNYVSSVRTSLVDLAQGRAAEFTFLAAALKMMGIDQ